MLGGRHLHTQIPDYSMYRSELERLQLFTSASVLRHEQSLDLSAVCACASSAINVGELLNSSKHHSVE